MHVSGFGSSNDGNTARRFFADVEKTSEITKIDVVIIRRFATILAALNTTKTLVDPDMFKTYCHQTARLYIEKYRW